jgi:hypothetical protein
VLGARSNVLKASSALCRSLLPNLRMRMIKFLSAALTDRSKSKIGFEGCWHGVAIVWCKIEMRLGGQTLVWSVSFVCLLMPTWHLSSSAIWSENSSSAAEFTIARVLKAHPQISVSLKLIADLLPYPWDLKHLVCKVHTHLKLSIRRSCWRYVVELFVEAFWCSEGGSIAVTHRLQGAEELGSNTVLSKENVIARVKIFSCSIMLWKFMGA